MILVCNHESFTLPDHPDTYDVRYKNQEFLAPPASSFYLEERSALGARISAERRELQHLDDLRRQY